MRAIGRVLILVVLGLLIRISAYSQNISNEGTEFWSVFPTHDNHVIANDLQLANITIYITSKSGSYVTITCGSYVESANIPPNQAVPFTITRAQAYIENSQSNTVLENKAIHIKVREGEGKVAVYAHIFAGARSAASLILPVESLGQKYHSMNYTQDSEGHNFLVLAAAEPNTKLLIHHGGSPIEVVLEKAGDVYQYMPRGGADLTGAYVEIDPSSPDNCTKRFAAFSGSTSTTIGSCNSSRDPLYQQLYPISSWGKTYGVVPFVNRRHIIRVVAQENDTRVQYNGLTFQLNKGQYYESPQLITPGLVKADKNISVAQYSLTQTCSSVSGFSILGDPEMVLLNPIEFNIKSVILFSSTKENIGVRYINVYMKTNATGSFRLDGQQTGFNWKEVPSDPEYSFMQLQIANTYSVLTADEGFNAIAYGFGASESYAYSAGTTLAASDYLRVLNRITNQDAKGACVNQPSDFKIYLPAPAEEISWTLDNEPPVAGSTIPTEIITDASGVTTYEYTYAYGRAFTSIAQHKMVVTAKLPTVGSCIGSEYVYTYTFDVEPVPLADFSFINLGCDLEGTSFTDLSDSGLPTEPISKWIWDFGDGSPLVYDRNPVHRFPRTGIYEVKLSVGTEDGCMSDVLMRTIDVALVPSPAVVFELIPDLCLNKGLFTINTARETKGVSGTGVFTGRGVSPDGVFDPLVAGIGVHEITYTYIGNLLTASNTYCQDVKKQTITVVPSPSLEFERNFYVLRGGAKTFNAIDAGPQATYKWSPSIGLDRDDVLNPVITGEEDRVYTLTATTATGCIAIESIVVNVLDNIKVANAFSPNGDGINDVWKIEFIDNYPNVTVQIFNRFGITVFSSKGYAIPFDGKYENKELPTETYFYVIDPGNGSAKKSGSLSIIK